MYNKQDWKELKNKGKHNFVIFFVTLFRMLPIGLVLLVIFELFETGFDFYRAENFLLKLSLIIVVFIPYGLLAGNIEWKFFNEVLKNVSEKKRRYYTAFIEGVINWGFPIAIVLFISEKRSFAGFIPLLIIWGTAGMVYGLIMTRDFKWE